MCSRPGHQAIVVATYDAYRQRRVHERRKVRQDTTKVEVRSVLYFARLTQRGAGAAIGAEMSERGERIGRAATRLPPVEEKGACNAFGVDYTNFREAEPKHMNLACTQVSRGR